MFKEPFNAAHSKPMLSFEGVSEFADAFSNMQFLHSGINLSPGSNLKKALKIHHKRASSYVDELVQTCVFHSSCQLTLI